LINSTRLGADLGHEKSQAGQIATGTDEAGHQPSGDRIGHGSHHDRNRLGGLLGRQCARRAVSYDHIDVELDQLGGERGETVESVLGPPIVNADVLALLVSELAQAREEGVH
jgi:hypothetical protein